MQSETYFYNCSRPYLNGISADLYPELVDIVSKLPKRTTQSEINRDLFWILASKGWSYDTAPPKVSARPPEDLGIEGSTIQKFKDQNKRDLCITSTTVGAKWYADFAKLYGDKLVQLEAQFGKVESMFKDFCGFKIGWYERRLALGVQIVMCQPSKYFSHRKSSTSGMAYFEIAKKTLPAIALDCPIWLLGMRE